jgi:hypothetical protein
MKMLRHTVSIAALVLVGLFCGIQIGVRLQHAVLANANPCATPVVPKKPVQTGGHHIKLLLYWRGRYPGKADEIDGPASPTFITRYPFTLWVKASAIDHSKPATGDVFVANTITDDVSNEDDQILLGAGDPTAIFEARIPDMANCKVGCQLIMRAPHNVQWTAEIEQ